MSTETDKKQKGTIRRELLAFGYVRENYNDNVPNGVILLMVDFSKACLESNILTQEEQEYLISMIEQQPQTLKFRFNPY